MSTYYMQQSNNQTILLYYLIDYEEIILFLENEKITNWGTGF